VQFWRNFYKVMIVLAVFGYVDVEQGQDSDERVGLHILAQVDVKFHPDITHSREVHKERFGIYPHDLRWERYFSHLDFTEGIFDESSLGVFFCGRDGASQPIISAQFEVFGSIDRKSLGLYRDVSGLYNQGFG